MLTADKPKTLFFDIEAVDLKADRGYVLCIYYAFDDGPVKALKLDSYPGKTFYDDSKLLEAFKPVFNRAAIAVAHFGERYDLPFIQTRLLMAGFTRLSEVQFVDTWKISRKKLALRNNRLDTIAEAMGCPWKKTGVSLKLWKDAEYGNKKARQYVYHHCAIDVEVLRFVYNKIKALWPLLPRSGAFGTCRACGGRYRSDGIRPTVSKIYRRLRCVECGFPEKGEVVSDVKKTA